MLIYALVSAFLVFFNAVYSLYGHGVHSASMTLMFLYPLIGGVLGFALLWLFCPAAETVRRFRLLYNLYNAGVATLIIGSMIKGVLDIAGTASPYTAVYFIIGWLLTGIGFLYFLHGAVKRKQPAH